MKIKLKLPALFKSKKRREAERKKEATNVAIEMMEELTKLYR